MQFTPLSGTGCPSLRRRLQDQYGKPSRLAVQGWGTRNRAVTHLGFQFCDLQVQFIQMLVHKSDECLKEKHTPVMKMETPARVRPWRPPLRFYPKDKDQCDHTGQGPAGGASQGSLLLCMRMGSL